jgi:glutamate-5-semialdehyde dehydrogenase
LVVPRGGNEFVRHVQDATRIPVLGHSAGICHIYVDGSAQPEMAVQLCYDARVQYPASCNSMKVLLVDERASRRLLPRIARRLVAGGVKIKACRRSLGILRSEGIPAEAAAERDWSTEYLDLTLPVKVVGGVDEAIAHINRHGSRHTDSIVSEDPVAVMKFLRGVDSANVMHNASTRFSDGYRYGLGAEVGISTNKVHARGPVGLEGLVTTKYVLMGAGQKVSDYTGRNARRFVHRRFQHGSRVL